MTNISSCHRRCGMTALTATFFGAAAVLAADPPQRSAGATLEWPMFGQNTANTASGVTFAIDKSNVSRLKPKWIFTTTGDVSARAAVAGGSVYFPDWGGQVYRLDAATGTLIWSRNLVADYGFTPAPGSTKVLSRVTPAVEGSTVYIGTQATASGAYVLAVDKSSGLVRWKTQLDTHPFSADTSSPVVLNGVVYVGVSSLEEGAAIDPGYQCCSFRGSVMAIDAMTGAVIWKQYTVPPGYTGGPVWGSTVIPDPRLGQVYVTTGNNYRLPTDPDFLSCVAGSMAEDRLTRCLSPDDHLNSVLALDMKSGAVRWSRRLSGSDDWNGACFTLGRGEGNCPEIEGPDYDFGSGPNLFVVASPSGPREILGAGQKSGVYSAFDPKTGRMLWATAVGPGSILGGIQWGAATDGRRIYVAIANFDGLAYEAGMAGSISALDALTGKILWQVPDPNGAIDLGPVAVANGVVYAGSGAGAATANNMLALDAASGAILWGYPSGGSVVAGASIVDGAVYWGSGYLNFGLPGFTGNNRFYAFTLDGK